MSEIHELKTWCAPFDSVWRGQKRYEIRRNDRNFGVGDQLVLREYDHLTHKYTGRKIVARVTYMSKGGDWDLPKHMCVMSIEPSSYTNAWEGDGL